MKFLHAFRSADLGKLSKAFAALGIVGNVALGIGTVLQLISDYYERADIANKVFEDHAEEIAKMVCEMLKKKC